MICSNCGQVGGYVQDIIDAKRMICSNCGSEFKEAVSKGQTRIFTTDLNFGGYSFDTKGDSFKVLKVGVKNTDIDYKDGSIQALPTGYILNNTEVVNERE